MDQKQDSDFGRSLMIVHGGVDITPSLEELSGMGYSVWHASGFDDASLLLNEHPILLLIFLDEEMVDLERLSSFFKNKPMLINCIFLNSKNSKTEVFTHQNKKITYRFIRQAFCAEFLPVLVEDSFQIYRLKHQNISLLTELDHNNKQTEIKIEEKAIELRKLVLKTEKAYEKYKLVSENISDVIWVMDVNDSRFSYISPSVYQLLGYRPEEALNITIYDTLTPDSKLFYDSIREDRFSLFKLTNQPKLYYDELQHYCKNGNVIWVETASRYQINSDGVIEVLGVSRNIDQRKKAEQRIRENEIKYRQVFATTADAMLIVDPTTKQILNANHAAVELYGYGPDEFLFKTLNDIGFMANPLDLNFGSDKWNGYSYRRPTDGRLFMIESKSSMFKIDDMEFMIFSSKDVTIRIHAELMKKNYTKELEQRVQEQTSELLEMNKRFKLSLEAGEMVWWDWQYADNRLIFDYQGEVFTINFSDMLEDAEGNDVTWYSFLHPSDLQEIPANLLKALSSESKEYEQDFRLKQKGGQWCWYRTKGKVIELDDKNEPLRLAGIAYDISRQKQMEQSMEQALKREKELNEHKSEFISLTSHQFRTPLTTILSSSELMGLYANKLHSDVKPMFDKHISKIKEETKRLNSLMTDILVIGRIESSRMPFIPSKIDLVQLCKHIISEHFEDNKRKEKIIFNVYGAEYNCMVDSNLINHIVINLLSNALKYSNGSDPILELHFQNKETIIKVIDKGLGIPEEAQPHIFSSFYRAKNVETIEGSGLGLNIAKKMVEMHDGTINFESKLGAGTVFVVALPRVIV